MPIIIFDTKDEIPTNLQSGAKHLEDGKYELDASGVLNKNSELLGKVKDLSADAKSLETENQRLNSEVNRLKSSSLADGMVAVEPEIEKLGNAAKKAELKLSEIPTLKTAKDEADAKLNNILSKEVIQTAADATGLNKLFVTMASDKNLQIETKTEKDDKGADITKFYQVAENGSKTALDEFLKTDSFFAQFAETFVAGDKPTVKPFGAQFKNGDNKLLNKFDQIRAEKEAEESKKSTAASGTFADRFYNRTQGADSSVN